MIRASALAVLFAAALSAPAVAQQPKPTGYPDRDILSPFRNPAEVYAPPDKLFGLLRQMRQIADDKNARKSFDQDGREVVDDGRWRAARHDVDQLGIDAGYLAGIMRMSKNADDRATAFYAAFYCKNVGYVFNLISHIPGEPWRKTREAALPRAAEFVKANLGRRYGQLSDDEKRALSLPKPGSPEAKAAGITRGPLDDDPLHTLNLVPFFQLLDVDDALDQAQALWFLQQVFTVRKDLALVWLEPMLPRMRQLLISDDDKVKAQALGLFATIGPEDLARPADDADNQALLDWAYLAQKTLFPPIRNLNDTVVQMQPSAERDALLAAAKKAIADGSIGDATHGKAKDGTAYRGYRIARVPDELQPLAIPAGAVITTINGSPVGSAAEVATTVGNLLDKLKHPRVLVVEYVLDGISHAIEYRIL
ncbi:MAG: hypothetical protein H6838_02185 [Planctomycetes bacterium]|nr:hypothetical protein [Planctomycetota bacterium]MCB9884268.1 hypothetical protein [Planctomycetota bacterium]